MYFNKRFLEEKREKYLNQFEVYSDKYEALKNNITRLVKSRKMKSEWFTGRGSPYDANYIKHLCGDSNFEMPAPLPKPPKIIRDHTEYVCDDRNLIYGYTEYSVAGPEMKFGENTEEKFYVHSENTITGYTYEVGEEHELIKITSADVDGRGRFSSYDEVRYEEDRGGRELVMENCVYDYGQGALDEAWHMNNFRLTKKIYLYDDEIYRSISGGRLIVGYPAANPEHVHYYRFNYASGNKADSYTRTVYEPYNKTDAFTWKFKASLHEKHRLCGINVFTRKQSPPV